jgi:hypothetical protein
VTSWTFREDLNERQRVAVVDESLARRASPNGTALGSTIGIPLDGRAVEARVVGIVEDVRNDDLATPGRGTIYVPYRQEASRDISFVVRTAPWAPSRLPRPIGHARGPILRGPSLLGNPPFCPQPRPVLLSLPGTARPTLRPAAERPLNFLAAEGDDDRF